MRKHYAPPTAEQMDRLLAFLPLFERPDFVPALAQQVPEQLKGSFMAMQQEWATELAAFHQVIDEEGFAFSFAWSEWQEQAAATSQSETLNHPETLAQADLHDLCRLLTTHVRTWWWKLRFSANQLPSMVRCGHITRLLQRLDKIRQSEVPQTSTP
jgi:hypothetical protein